MATLALDFGELSPEPLLYLAAMFLAIIAIDARVDTPDEAKQKLDAVFRESGDIHLLRIERHAYNEKFKTYAATPNLKDYSTYHGGHFEATFEKDEQEGG